MRKPCECGVPVAGTAITLAVIAVLAWSGWRDYRETFERGGQLTRQVARVAAEHVQRYVAAPEQALRRMDDHFRHRDPATIGTADDHAYILSILADLPEADTIVIVDAAGTVRLLSHTFPAPPIDVSDRYYYRVFAEGKRDGTVIGPLITPRAPKAAPEYRFTISRPIMRDGRFAGTIQASVYASRIETFLQSLDLPSDAATLVLTRDGWVIARQRILPEHLTNNYADTPLFTDHLAQAPSGTYRRAGSSDGVDRLYSYYALPDLPLVAVSGLPVAGLTGEWTRRFLRSAMVALGLLVVTWTALWSVWRATRREKTLIADLEGALSDKQVLFNEIHHRVKNNMQIISSMLMMEQVRTRDPVMASRLETLSGRISSMALVHTMLYERQEAADVDMRAYLEELCANLSASFGAADRSIAVTVDCDGTKLPMERAVPVGLLVNEAVSNAFKHAFPEDGGGTIRVMFAGGEDGLHISVGDNGAGMPEDGTQDNGLGLTIIQALARQLNGAADFIPGPGTVLRVWAPG